MQKLLRPNQDQNEPNKSSHLVGQPHSGQTLLAVFFKPKPNRPQQKANLFACPLSMTGEINIKTIV